MRGMATMDLRVRQASSTAQELAERLVGHSAIRELHYPGLADNPHQRLAQKQFFNSRRSKSVWKHAYLSLGR